MKTEKELIKLIPYETARAAYYWNSFSPDERAKSTINEFATTIIALYVKLEALDNSRIEEIEKDIEDFTAKYLKKYLVWLSAKSRTASSAITGPARFPTEKNRKALDLEHKRLSEMNDWEEKVKKILIKKYKIVAKEDMQKVIEEYRGYFQSGQYTKENTKNALMTKLLRVVKDDPNRFEEIKELLKGATDMFTAKHKIHRELEAIKIKQTAESNEEEVNGIRIVDNIQENRIQLFFEGKPEKDTITYLKSKCWKWTPSKSCWQNWRNPQRMREIKEYLKRI